MGVAKGKDMIYCEACGSPSRKYSVNMTAGLVNALVKFRQTVGEKNENKVHLLQDMKGRDYELTDHEWNNFSRLRFHALVAKYKVNGVHVAGYWLLTHRGAQFLNGEVQIPKKVDVLNNVVVGRSEEMVGLIDLMGKLPQFENIAEIEYQEATEEDVKVVISKKKKKKGAKMCKCGGVMKKGLRDIYVGDVARVSQYYKCMGCGVEEKYS